LAKALLYYLFIRRLKPTAIEVEIVCKFITVPFKGRVGKQRVEGFSQNHLLMDNMICTHLISLMLLKNS
jgi:hypothetical protein